MYPLPIQDRDAFFKLDIESSVSPSNRGLGSGQKPFTQALEVDHWQRANPLQCGFRGEKEVMLRPPQAPRLHAWEGVQRKAGRVTASRAWVAGGAVLMRWGVACLRKTLSLEETDRWARAIHSLVTG